MLLFRLIVTVEQAKLLCSPATKLPLLGSLFACLLIQMLLTKPLH